MKYKSVLFAVLFLLVQSGVCRNLHNDAKVHRRNSRRINEGNTLAKAVIKSLSDEEKPQEDGTPFTTEATDVVGRSVSLSDDISLSENDSNFPENTKPKRRRLVEVRKSKVNTNGENPDIVYRARDDSANGKYLPNWAIPKREQMSKPEFRIVDMENYVFSNRGEFHYSYESADGTKAYERGELRKLDDNSKGTAVFGGFSYKGKDGENYNLKYTADENGYRPVGDHLPTPPPIPPAIARALFYLATKSPPPAGSPEDPVKYDYNDYY